MLTAHSKGSRRGGRPSGSRGAPRGLVVGVRPGRLVHVVPGREREPGRERGGRGKGGDRRQSRVRSRRRPAAAASPRRWPRTGAAPPRRGGRPRGRARHQVPAVEPNIARRAASRVSRPSAGMRAISLSISASSNAAAHAGPPPTTISGNRQRHRAHRRKIHASRLGHVAPEAAASGAPAQHRARSRRRRTPPPKRQPARVRARRRLRARHRPLRPDALHDRGGRDGRERGVRGRR